MEPIGYPGLPGTVASGGLMQAAQALHPNIGVPQATPPRLPDQGNIPRIVSATGLGTGGGAGFRHDGQDCDASHGRILVRVGPGASNSGSIVMNWASTPPAASGNLLVFVNPDFGTVVVTQGNPATIAWTNASGPPSVGQHTMVYQWQTNP